MGITTLLPIVTPLWYVRNLLVFCLLLPLMVAVARSVLATRVGVVVAVMVFVLACIVDLPAKKNIVMSIIYFQLGVVLALSPESWRESIRKFKFWGYGLFATSIAYAVFCACKGIEPVGCLRYVLIPLTIVSLWFLSGLIKREISSPILNGIFSLSFPIYVLHYFPLHYVISHGGRLTGWGVFAWSFCTIFGIIVLTVACRKICPAGYRIAFGGR